MLTSITTQPDGGAIGSYSNIGLTGSLNGEGAEATIELDATNNISTITVTTTGSGYVKDEIITIPSSSLGASSGGGTDAVITLVSNDLDLAYISNGTGNYVFTVPANGINTNSNHLDEDIVTLKLKADNFIYEEELTPILQQVAINENGVITDVVPCKFNTYFSLFRQGNLFNPSVFLQIPIQSGYSVGDFVNLSGYAIADGCFEITGTVPTPITPPLDPPMIVFPCTPPTPTLYPINLGFGTNKTIACGATPTSYKIDEEYFCSTSKIYNTDGTLAGPGYYSFNNTLSRYQSNSGTLGNCESCSSYNFDISINTGGGGGNKIICNELYRQGYLSEKLWDADERYGDMMFVKDPKMIIGYQMWARKVVKYMRVKPEHTKYLYRILKPWTEYMGYEMGVINKQNYIGKITHNIAKYASYLVFNLGGGKRLLNLYNYKKFKKSIK